MAEDCCKCPDYKFPEVFLRPPRCLIALSGLDVTNNAVHRQIWDEFSSGIKRPDRRPILFKNFPADHLYPKCGRDRTTYEDYALQGILKLSWIDKHCNELPAMVALFFDLDWDDPQWEERQTECVSKVEVIKSALQNRATEIVIVLLQSSPLPMGEASNISSERAAALCSSCELSRLNLFVLPFTQRLQGFIIKIEEAFYKKVILYYSNKIHVTRAHKEMVANRQAQQLLFVRHNFKIAFFAEMKQEPHTALKLYRAAYTHLLENMYLSEDRGMEFKMVAGFISYKICRLCFENGEAVDAINQFRKHIDRFSLEVGLKHLVYEHHEWLSRQYSAFADLFSERVRRGSLKAVKSLNPGLYYHQASIQAILRKKVTQELPLDLRNTQLLPGLPQTTYFGQRPWRKSLTDDKPSNMDIRHMCIVTMQNAQKKLEHSWQIIPLLMQAISNLKNYGCERLSSHLEVLIAEEYYHVMEYEKSYVFLNEVVELYRTEQWWDNLASILLNLLRYAYLMGYVQEYVVIGLELISRYFPLDFPERRRIQRNILEVFSNQEPYPEPKLSSEEIQAANVKWTEFWTKYPSKSLTIQMSSIASCVECKTVFMKQSFMADQQVKVKVYLRCSAPLPLSVHRLIVLFTNKNYNSMCIQGEEFVLEPNVLQSLSFSFPSSPESVGSTIKVHAVEAVLLCDRTDKCLGVAPTLVWSNGTSEPFSSQPSDLLCQTNELFSTTMIIPRSPNVFIFLDHSKPALTEEYYEVSVNVRNDEATPISNVRIKLTLPSELLQPAVGVFENLPSDLSLSDNDELEQNSLEFSCPQLASNGSVFTKKIYLCSHSTGSRKIDVTVTYQITCNDGRNEPVVCICEKGYSEVLLIITPFEMTFKLMTTKFRLANFITCNSPFILMTRLTCSSSYQLHIEDSQLKLNEHVQGIGENFSQIEGLVMEPSDQATECYFLLTSSNQSNDVSIGTYTVKWNRIASSTSRVITSSVSFPPITAKYQICTLSADVPAYGQLLEVFRVSYTVNNLSHLVQEFEAKMGTSDAFMYSGNRLWKINVFHTELLNYMSKFRILPSSKHTFMFNLLPIVIGLSLLPSLDISCLRESENADLMPSKNIPTSILIKPSPIRTTPTPVMSEVL